MFDIDKIEASAQNTFDLNVGQDEEGRPVGFRVVGTASEQYERADRAIQLMNVKEMSQREGPLDLSTDDGAEIAVEGGAQRRDIIIRECVVDWFGFTANGEPAPFNQENLERILKRRPQWRTKILAAIEDDANFTGG